MGAGPSRTMLAGDIGSTFTKFVALSQQGDIISAGQVPTRREAIAEGVEEALSAIGGDLAAKKREISSLDLSSSAGGGLRVLVVGLEPKLTLEAGRRASATAGARIVASWTLEELGQKQGADVEALAADLALLTGGTNGGAVDVIAAASHLDRLAPSLPLVVAANEATYDTLASSFADERVIRFAANLMPRVGELEEVATQAEIRALFVDHVIASVKLAARPRVAEAVRMPTPAAVLLAAQAVADSGAPVFSAPVVVDLGGATTDVHSVLGVGDDDRGYASTGFEPQQVTRTVEGDLGMRENAESLVAVARAEGWLEAMGPARVSALQRGAERRSAQRGFLPDSDEEHCADEDLAQLATEIAIARHAGVLRTTLTASGAVLQKTGRDLRHASCVIATGGVFRHARRAGVIVARALGRVAERGGLVTPGTPVVVDRAYLLWAVGLLSTEQRPAAQALLAKTTGVGPV